jgi:hypothetical protein
VGKAKRKALDKDTLRELFLKCGNQCAFPDCTEVMINRDGVFVGQICHIEAAEEGGERFNPDMTDNERAAFPNLMLMCYPHHVTTNDVDMYRVPKLQAMKAEHEAKFTDPAQAILDGDARQLAGDVVQVGANNRAVTAPNTGTIILGDTHHHHPSPTPPEPKLPAVDVGLALTNDPRRGIVHFLVITLRNTTERSLFIGNFMLELNDGHNLLCPRDCITGQFQRRQEVRSGDRASFHIDVTTLKQFGRPAADYLRAVVTDSAGPPYFSEADVVNGCVAELLTEDQ